MSEELLYVLESSNNKEIEDILNQESICEQIKEDNLELNILRMKDTGVFGVFLSKEDGEFTRKELLVIERYLNNTKRTIDVKGKERVGVILDKENDIKPFNNVDMLFPYNKTYKSQAYARMIGLGMMGEVKDLNSAMPDKEITYKFIY